MTCVRPKPACGAGKEGERGLRQGAVGTGGGEG